VVVQKRVSSLLEQAQFFFKTDERSSSPHSELELVQGEATVNSEDCLFEGDSDELETETHSDPILPDRVESIVEHGLPSESMSDELFDVDFDLAPEDFEALDISSNVQTASSGRAVQESSAEEEALFGDGYDELMDLDFDDTQPDVKFLKT